MINQTLNKPNFVQTVAKMNYVVCVSVLERIRTKIQTHSFERTRKYIVKTQYGKWKKKVGCPPAILPMLTYLDEAFESSDTPLLLWHDTCRATFMSTWNIDFITLEAPNKSR